VYSSALSITSVHHNLAAVVLGTTGTICIGAGWAPGPVWWVWKFSPPLGYGVQTVHPLASRCTNCYTKD